jgi:hypothetical protein
MLSDELLCTAEVLNGWAAAGGVNLSARNCALLSRQLAACAEQAQHLEGLPVPGEQRVLPHGNVVVPDFTANRRARDRLALLAGGGDAA